MPNLIKFGRTGAIAGNMVKCTPRALYRFLVVVIFWELLQKND